MIVAYCRCSGDSIDTVAQAFKIGAMVALCKACGGAIPAATYEDEEIDDEEQEDDSAYDESIATEARREIGERLSEAGLEPLAFAVKCGDLKRVAIEAAALYIATHGKASRETAKCGCVYTRNKDGSFSVKGCCSRA